MAKLRHIALSVRDPERSAEFYMKVFGMRRVDQWDQDMGRGSISRTGSSTSPSSSSNRRSLPAARTGSMSASAPTISASWSTISTNSRKRIEENGGQLYLDPPMSRELDLFRAEISRSRRRSFRHLAQGLGRGRRSEMSANPVTTGRRHLGQPDKRRRQGSRATRDLPSRHPVQRAPTKSPGLRLGRSAGRW